MTNSTCSIPGCELGKPPLRRGMCEPHYRRFMKYGDPHGGMGVYNNNAERFWSKVDRRSDTECWPWLGHTDPDGYGVFTVDHKNVRAHRYAYELLVGPIPPGLVIDHVRAKGCTRRDCMNALAHLEPVTPRTNTMRGDAPPAENATKTACKRGHAFTPDNTYEYADGRRSCRTCMRDHTREWARRKRGSGRPGRPAAQP